MRGRKRPVASANPATVPEGSARGSSVTVQATALVPKLRQRSPGAGPGPGRWPYCHRSPAPPLTRCAPTVRPRPGVRAPVGAWRPSRPGRPPISRDPVDTGLRRGPVAGSRRVAPVGGLMAGKSKGEPVVGQQHRAHPSERVGLAPFQPSELGDGEAGQRHASAGLGPGGRPPLSSSTVPERPARTRCRSTTWPVARPHRAGRR